MPYIVPVKSELRQRMKASLAAMAAEDIRRKSAAACERLLTMEECRRARSVMIYLPLPAEADPTPIARAAWREGKTVLAPRVDWDSETMLPAEIDSLENHTAVGRHGIRSPDRGKVWRPRDIDLLVVPALAIDRRGNRLGRGGGFYDRFLAQDGLRAAVCAFVFQEQLLDELPHLPHDRPVGMVVTDGEILRFGGESA